MSKGHSTSAVPRPRSSAPRVRAAESRSERRAADRADRADRAVARADRAADGAGPRRRQSWYDHDAAADPGPDRARPDHTRFGARILDDDLQIATRRPQRWLIALVALAVLAALIAALFVLPVQAWLRQEDEIAAKRQELEVLDEANRKLGVEVDHLATPEGAKEAARDELGVVGPGEERISVLPGETGPLPLPAGWPYDTINQIVAVRAAAPTAP